MSIKGNYDKNKKEPLHTGSAMKLPGQSRRFVGEIPTVFVEAEGWVSAHTPAVHIREVTVSEVENV